MLKLEEYIAKRKKEDLLNEFDKDKKDNNLKICVNYIFEYFNNYLNITELEERTILKNEKLEKYRRQLENYEHEIQEWLVNIYSEYGNFLDKSIGKRIKNEEIYFFLMNEESEFRSLSYECYAKYIKKFPYLKGQEEKLYKFLKEYHRVESQLESENNPSINQEIDEWIEKTKNKYGVNLYRFASDWVNYFYEDKELWGAGHKIKTQDTPFVWYEYNYKNGSNLFNIDSLYRNMPKKSFTKGRKQEFEILFMYYWLHEIDSDDDYWQEYLDKVLNNKINN